MNILHKGTDPTLLARLREMLGSSVRADMAVGYFFISGFEAIASDLARLDGVRILVGRTDRRVLEEVAAGLQQAGPLAAQLDADGTVRRSERSAAAGQAVSHIAQGVAKLPQGEASEAAVQQLRELVASGKVEIRSYVRDILHAKAYLCWYPDQFAEHGSAVVGSSNLTLAAFTQNTELNVRVTGDAEMAALREWFDELWEDSEPIGDELLAEIDRSWVNPATPYHVYLKALYELFPPGAPAEALPDPTQSTELANYQKDAVTQGLKMIEQYGGCYIGDVVGLGKTFIGAELLRQLEFQGRSRGKPLILCPAGLIPMWEHFNERFNLGAAVVSQSMIAPSAGQEFDEELGRFAESERSQRGVVLQEAYPGRGPVLVDEAHNFRNINKRYRALEEYLEQSKHDVILMSATPQNLGPRDIYRQLSLFLDEFDHKLKIEPLSLEEYFSNAQQWLDYEHRQAEFDAWQQIPPDRDGKRPTPPERPTQPKAPQVRIEDVLREVFIRRRRRDIRDLYGDTAEINGEPIRFPDPRLENIEYRLDRVYERAATFPEIQAALQAHQASRYRATKYLREEHKKLPKYDGLLRSGDRVAGLMKVLLLKRLESSVAAFRSTLESLMTSNRRFREALEAGYVPVGALATRMLNGQSFDAQEALEILSQEDEARGSAHPVSDFCGDDWTADLDADHDVLSRLHAQVSEVEPSDDDKLQALKRFMARDDVSKGKLLIFSEAETTIDYLYEQLNPGGADPKIARLTGTNRETSASVVQRFAPKANPSRRGYDPSREIRVLLATDVVSEGQNLQDCARVLNYDLHWNPVRLIQRFGRVDRIGTEHSTIHLHSMWPDLEVDARLSLTERLNQRVQLFHDLIGLDSRLLTDTERLNAADMYRIYGDGKLPESADGLEELSVHQRQTALLQRIRREEPGLWELIVNLPDGIRAAVTAKARPEQPAPINVQQPLEGMPSRPFEEPKAGETLVLLADSVRTKCYAVGDDLQPREIRPVQLIVQAECAPDTPPTPLPRGTNQRVMAAFKVFEELQKRSLGRARRPSQTKARKWVRSQLNALLHQTDDAALRQRINELRQIVQGPLQSHPEAALNDTYTARPVGEALLRRLNAWRETYRLMPPEVEAEPQRAAPEVIRIVCSDGLL